MKQEGGVLRIDDKVMVKGKEVIKCCLLGKIMLRKPINKKTLKDSINNLWKIDDLL